MKKPVIVPVEPFDAKAIALAARELHQSGVEWELDWLENRRAAQVCRWLEQFGVVPFGTAAQFDGGGGR